MVFDFEVDVECRFKGSRDLSWKTMAPHHFPCSSGQPRATPAETLWLPVCTQRYYSSSYWGIWGFGSWSSCCYFRKKKKRRKERSGPSKRETSAGTQDTAGFQAAGSAINQLQVAPLPRAWLRQAGCSKGNPRQRHGTAEPPHPARHMGAGLPGRVTPKRGPGGEHCLTLLSFVGGKDTTYLDADLGFKESPTHYLNS